MRKICVIGNSSIETKIFAKKFPSQNSEVNIEKIYTNLGGSGFCSATVLCRLGFEVSIITQIGEDPNGNKILTALEKAGVETKYVIKSSNTTLFFSIFDRLYNRKIFIKNTDWNEMTILSYLQDAIQNADIVILCPSKPSIFMEALEIGRNLKKTLINSPQSAFFYQSSDIVDKIFKYSDMLFLNENEICKYKHTNNYRNAINKLKINNEQIIVITRGKNGCIVLANNKIITQASIKGEVIDPSGAGDSFMAGFLWALEQKYDLKKAAYIGCIAGHYACRTTNLVEDGFSINDLLKNIKKGGEISGKNRN